MRFSSFLTASCVFAGVAHAGRDLRHVKAMFPPKKGSSLLERGAPSPPPSYSPPSTNPPSYAPSSNGTMPSNATAPSGGSAPSNGSTTGWIVPQTDETLKFKVDGKGLPDVPFDIGESYAGSLPISNKTNSSELFFWFFPSENAAATDEILIWLNGGPGCSSLMGLLQENGNFLWQTGERRPVKNSWAWTKLTNVVWIEQPAGTGFSRLNGNQGPQNEYEMAEQFLGFWKNFVDTFQLHNRKVFITGESYAGQYVPYIASAMHNATDTEYYNVDSIMIYDPIISYNVISFDIPATPFADYWQGLFNLNETFRAHIHDKFESCGWKDFMDLALTFPPTGILPTPPAPDGSNLNCDLFDDIAEAAYLVNPCWNIYHISDTCPLLYDVLGHTQGGEVYFARHDVQKAIHAPIGDWGECAAGVLQYDDSPPSGLSVLPAVIEKNQRTILGSGALDYILMTNGTIMAVQNMTFNGGQGFSTPPSDWDDFYVPYHGEYNVGSWGGAGNFGKWHTERGLTFCTVELAGHMVPGYAPTAAYRQLEFLLGRIDNLGVISDFTTQKGSFGNNNATVAML